MICDDHAETEETVGAGRAGTAQIQTDAIRTEADRWYTALESDTDEVRADFVAWARQSPRHFSEFLRVSAERAERAESTGNATFEGSPVESIAERSKLQTQLYLRYRRPLLQFFHHRRVDRCAAEDLLQRTFLLAIKKLRTGGLDDPSNLGGYLCRTAYKLAQDYWRGELSRRHDNDAELLISLEDEALSLEERLSHEQLARYVRDLMAHLPIQRDREVLQRFYLCEEPLTEILEALQLNKVQFYRTLWRARQRFGDLLRKNGVSMAAVSGPVAREPSSSGVRASRY